MVFWSEGGILFMVVSIIVLSDQLTVEGLDLMYLK